LPFTFFRFLLLPLASPLITPPLFSALSAAVDKCVIYYLVAILRNVETRDQEPWASLVSGRAKVMDTSQDINGAGNYFYPKN
jgi:hypothetical protein